MTLPAKNFAFCHTCPLARWGETQGVCSIDGQNIIDHGIAAYCPAPAGPRFGSGERPDDWPGAVAVDASALSDPPRAAPSGVSTAATWGPPLWAWLHRACLQGEPDLATIVAALDTRTPCGDCRAGMRAFVAASPPDESDPFAWSVALHNSVNRKLGKPEMSVEEARAIYSAGGDRRGVVPASIDN